MTQRLAPAGLGFDVRCDPATDPVAEPPSVTAPAGRFGAPPGSEFGAAHHRPGRYGHQPDDDPDELVPPGATWFAELGWPAG